MPEEAIRIVMADLRRKIARFEEQKALELAELHAALAAGESLLSECSRRTDGGTPG
jgi:hypothetical protein